MSHCVYVIENLLDGKKYVGYTHDREGRWKEHVQGTRRQRCHTHLHRAMKKHGVENFRFYVVEECATMEDGYQQEIVWIERLSTFGPMGYNMSSGGDGPRGRLVSEETRRRMSQAHKGKVPWNKGRQLPRGFKHSEESRILMSTRKRGTVFTEAHRQKLREAWRRRKERHVEEATSEAVQCG